jgi:hypothetical protein
VFAAFFSISSLYLECRGLLTGQYVAMCSAVQAMMVGRAVAEDYHERNKDCDKDCDKKPDAPK